MTKSILAIFLICSIVNSVFSQYPPWLVSIGNTTTKEFFISDETKMLNVGEAKFECHKYNMKLTAIESGELSFIDSYFKETYGANTQTPPFGTSARISKDFSEEVKWSTTNGLVGPEVSVYYQGPKPGESQYVWYECPTLIRSCLLDETCEPAGCCIWKTRLIHTIQNYAPSNCLTPKRFICQRPLL